ncbi:MAG TPA: Holliday junction resolvase RuvX [Patescibacteria group bacterium]|jgi:putative Holliday junction resolvase|nr:Holliday junction resolvase RuvX [Patescibacteria group bacterium]
MRIIALDIGDAWTGVAISDFAGITARPLTTLSSINLIDQLKLLIDKERVTKIIIGYPQTMRGTESEQTKKVNATADEIKKAFLELSCIMLDERFSTQQASLINKKKFKTKEEKNREHAIAAAILLKSYLDHLYFLKTQDS